MSSMTSVMNATCWCDHVEKKDIKNENKKRVKRLHRLAKSVREKTRSSEEKEDEGGRHKSPVLVVIMMIITVIVDLDDLDDLDYVDDNPEYLTRTKRRGLLLAAATQARRESRRQIQQPEVQRESQV